MIGTIAGRELRDVLRETSLITAFLVQAFLAGFSALLLTGLTALHDPASIASAPDADVAFVGDGAFGDMLEQTTNLDVIRLSGDDALEAFAAGSIDAIIEERNLSGVQSISLILPDGELQGTLLIAQLKQMLLDYEEELRLQRQDRLNHDVVTMERVRPDAPFSFVYATLFPLLIITPVFLSGAIASDALSQESRTRTLLLLRSAPISATRLVLGKLVVPIALVPVQVAIWLALFAINGFPSPALSLMAFAATLGVLLTAAGTLVAAWVRDEAATQAAYAALLLGLAVLSLALPQDPLNIIARLATGAANADTWTTWIALAGAALAVLVAAVRVTGARLRRDLL